VQLLEEAASLVEDFQIPISGAALHVYHSALAFAPQESLLFKTFTHDQISKLKVLQPSRKNWGTKESEDHNHAIVCLSFSTDGGHVLSGSKDGSVRIWDTATGVSVLALRLDKPAIAAILSPDNTRIFTSSNNTKAVHVWDRVSGRLLYKLKHNIKREAQLGVSQDNKDLLLYTPFPSTTIRWDLTKTPPLLLHNQTDSTTIEIPNTYEHHGFAQFSARLSEMILCWFPVISNGVFITRGDFIVWGRSNGQVAIVDCTEVLRLIPQGVIPESHSIELIRFVTSQRAKLRLRQRVRSSNRS
jgi:hypothetical protein